MLDETITFELIRKIQREEQRMPKLTRLPEDFFNAVSTYLQNKRSLASGDDRKDFLEIKNVERLVEDIVNRRERKILNASIINARTKIAPENLTAEEKGFYNSLVNLIKNRRYDILQPISMAKRADSNLIIFKEDITEFVGSDMKTYGPYKRGETAILPQENIKLLSERGIVEEFKA